MLELHQTNAPPRLDELDVMELVSERFKVSRMTAVLDQFKIKRPRGLANKGKAKLIVNQVPREGLMKLLNEATLPPSRDGEATEEPPPAKCPRTQASGSGDGP